jgi:hypothetical protein
MRLRENETSLSHAGYIKMSSSVLKKDGQKLITNKNVGNKEEVGVTKKCVSLQ